MALLLSAGIRKAQQDKLPGLSVIKQMSCLNFLHYHRNMNKASICSLFYPINGVLRKAGG